MRLGCCDPWKVLAGLLAALPICAAGQEDAPEEESPYRPGLVATLSGEQGTSASRVDEAIAFDWGQSQSDPRLTPGKFTAQWQGRLWTQVEGTYRLQAYVGGGRVSLKLGGREVLAGEADAPRWIAAEPLELGFDRHPLEVAFASAGEASQLRLFWSGPNFVLEPIPARFFMHDREQTPATDFPRGRRLAAALRCTACHAADGQSQTPPAPALDRLSGNIAQAWLVRWLSEPADPKSARRMPHFGLTRDQAADVAAWLVRLPAEKQAAPKEEVKGKDKPAKPSADEGQRLFLTLGCLACHQHGELGESGLFGGGDLTTIATKRSPEFFARWLADPASFNRDHRMPTFDLSDNERTSLALWLAESDAPRAAVAAAAGDAAAGERLVTRLRCASCHALPSGDERPKPSATQPLTAESDWSRSCAGAPDLNSARPGYRMPEADAAALQAYFTAVVGGSSAPQLAGRDLLVELNCLACHQREGIDRAANLLPVPLQDKLAAVVAQHDDLAKFLPAMTPPALSGVGDKLHDMALADAIAPRGPPHRPYLLARMPRFRLTDEQLASLTAQLTATDRIPVGNALRGVPSTTPVAALVVAGPRLVTTDGFGCTSCHQVGSVLPDKAPLNARGPDLSLLERRIRREWFGRWCNNPARIVPRMEMPSVQVPVRGVLGEKIDDQLAAVWHILNTPGFEPPEPNPVRVLRLSGVADCKESPIVLHDVIKSGDKTYLFPLVIGLPNRHNILFDLETGRLAAWWLGDTARQRTKGKSWFWEMGGESIFNPGFEASELTLVVDGKELPPLSTGQFAATIDSFNRAGSEGIAFRRIVGFEVPTGNTSNRKVSLVVTEILRLPEPSAEASTGLVRELGITGVPTDMHARLRFVSQEVFRQGMFDEASRTLSLAGPGDRRLRFAASEAFRWNGDGSFDLAVSGGKDAFPSEMFRIEYLTALAADQYLLDSPAALPSESISIEIAPGFAARRLPLDDSIMPTGLAWKPDGTLVMSSLKGQVYATVDANRDGLPDALRLVADGLASPYGLSAAGEHIDVITKSALWRLVERGDSGMVDRGFAVASGWGMTDDYHDWAVGLMAGEQGEYYIGLPCQQDKRSEAAAKHRGQFLKLVPREAASDSARLFDIEVVSSGHRFPMGLARNREGELFVTDNQGNYNPFNELNHVRPGAHFGFINALEKDRGFKPPPLARPAIDIPHPWTRSVNGICFLETPPGLRTSLDGGIFGPLEGHLIGCEYDSRQLIRMTLQKVGETYQGAAYPLSIPADDVERGLLGPIVCAVSPRGELYVGNIRDSGWGAGNNVGDIVQIKVQLEQLPCGIAEVRANADGFTLDFFRPVDAAKAADAANYSIASYRRESTPAYGGPNLDRRAEQPARIEVSPDARRVTLHVDRLRAGFVYEFQLKSLAPGQQIFHPAQAHYTLGRIPADR